MTRALEVTLWVAGVALLVAATASTAARQWRAHDAASSFAEARKAWLTEASASPRMDDWSEQRIEAYRASYDAPIGMLEIAAVGLRAPVLEGEDETTLNSGVGWVTNGSEPGDFAGNVALAAHRDGLFRPLKDLAVGDEIRVHTIDRVHSYRVSELTIVEPTDVTVLDATSTPVLTLITCYPFYFVGHAPQRYIVRASLTSSEPVLPTRRTS